MIRLLHDHTSIELIDVEKKSLGGTTESESDTERNVFGLISSYASLVRSLDIDQRVKKTMEYELERPSLEDFVGEATLFYNDVQPRAHKLNQQITDLRREISELETLLETTNILTPLSVEYGDLGEGKYFKVFTGSVKTERVQRLDWNLRELTDGYLIFETAPIEKKGTSAVVVGVLHRHKDDVTRVLTSFGFVELAVPKDVYGSPDKVAQETSKKIADKRGQIEELEKARSQLVGEFGEKLLAFQEQLSIEKERVEAKRLMRMTGFALQFYGFVPKNEKDKIEALARSVDPDVIIEYTSDLPKSEFPTMLANHRWVGKPYEPLVKAYGTPTYGKDYDPSFLFFITFPLLFGIMFGDVLHGLLLMLIGAYGMRLEPLGRDPAGMGEELKDYLQKGGLILFICGIMSTFFGFVFNSFAGLHGTHAPSFMQDMPHLWANEGEAFEMFAGAQGTFLFLELSIVIGMIHITAALVLFMINKMRHGHVVDAIFFPGFLILGYLSFIALLFSHGVNLVDWFTSMEAKPFDMVILYPLFYGDSTPGFLWVPALPVAILMVLSFIIFFVYLVRSHGMDGFSEALDFSLSLLGNTVSYARLFALNVVHSILSLIGYYAANLPLRLPFDFAAGHSEAEMDLFGAAFQEVLIILMFIVGTVLVMSLELIITFLQTMRLHLVEFFSKLHFNGAGRLFKPFKAIRYHTKPAPPAVTG